MIDVASLRRSYTLSGLNEQDLCSNPMDLFEKWLQDAIDAKLYDPNAMVISTVDKNLQPHSRIVLLKDYSKSSLTFFTNLQSNKAHDIENNPKVSALFPWFYIERQVIFTGTCKKLPINKVLKYFHSRPIDSQIGAHASLQSSKISTRAILETKFFELKEKFKNKQIPVPSFWGGYEITFDKVEFWQGRENRLHDRFLYEKLEDGSYEISRLCP